MKPFLIFATLLLWSSVKAEVFTDGSLRYESISDSPAECTVLGFADEAGKNTVDLVIPSFAGCLGKSYAVVSVAPKAFYSAEITKVSFGSNIREIGEGAFSCCKTLSSITFGDNPYSIGDFCFLDDVSLKSISLPSSFSSLGKGVFRGCSGLESISLSSDIIEIPDYFFEDCVSLSHIYTEENIKKIGERSFANCASLNDFEFDSLESIGERCFSGCRSLKSLVLNQKLSEIPEGAFEHCSSLKSMVLGPNILRIGISAFNDCSSLSEIELGRKVNYLGSNAFGNCTSLIKVYTLNDVIPALSYDSFSSSTYQKAVLYVREDSEMRYRQSANWNRFSNIIGTNVFPLEVNAINMDDSFTYKKDGNVITLNGTCDTQVKLVTLDGYVLYSGNIRDGVKVDINRFNSPIFLIHKDRKTLVK